MDLIAEVKYQISSKFDMKDIGPSHFILGMEIKRNKKSKKLWLSRNKYVEGILKRFNMQGCKLVKVPICIGIKLYTHQCPK